MCFSRFSELSVQCLKRFVYLLPLLVMVGCAGVKNYPVGKSFVYDNAVNLTVPNVNKERKKLLEELVRANTELKDFSYTVSHDLKAPLRGISSIVRWLSEDYCDSLDGKGQEYLNKLLIR